MKFSRRHGVALGVLWSALALAAGAGRTKASPPADKVPPPQVVNLRVTEAGFEPATATVHVGRPVQLVVTRVTDATCATDLILPEHAIRVALPLNEAVEVTFTPKRTGKLVYGCAMEMMVSGVLVVQ